MFLLPCPVFVLSRMHVRWIPQFVRMCRMLPHGAKLLLCCAVLEEHNSADGSDMYASRHGRKAQVAACAKRELFVFAMARHVMTVFVKVSWTVS